jgi:hypothetical protein
MTRLRSLIKEVLSQESPYYIIQSLKTGSPKYIASVGGEKPSWVPDSRIKQAHKFATLEDAKNYLSKFDTKRTAFWHIYKRPSGDVGLGPDLKESKKDCNCGCNDCGGKAPILTESKVKHLISEGLKHHIDKKISLFESVYRIGSEKHLELIREARALWIRGIIEVSDDDKGLLETHLGHFGLYEGVEVPLDLPMVNEEVEKDINQLKNLPNRKERYNYIKNFSKEKLIDIADELYLDYEEYDDIEDKVLNSFGESLNEEVDGEGFSDKIIISIIKPEEVSRLSKVLNSNNIPFKTEKLGKVTMFKFKSYDDIDKVEALISRNRIDIDEGFYSSPSDLEDSGLNVIPKDQIHANKLQDALEDSGLYGEWNPREGYFFFPEKEDGYDQLEMAIQELMDDYNIQGYIEGVFEESLNENNLLRQTNLSSEEYQKAKKLKGFNADDYTFSSDNNLYVKKSSLEERIDTILEAKKKKKSKKKDPPLNKPKRGGSKAYYVYVRDPKTKKIKKVSFGSGGLRAKIKNKEARNAFAARHNCKNKKDRTKAGYWSCNLPRYADQLGLGSKMNTFW